MQMKNVKLLVSFMFLIPQSTNKDREAIKLTTRDMEWSTIVAAKLPEYLTCMINIIALSATKLSSTMFGIR